MKGCELKERTSFLARGDRGEARVTESGCSILGLLFLVSLLKSRRERGVLKILTRLMCVIWWG